MAEPLDRHAFLYAAPEAASRALPTHAAARVKRARAAMLFGVAIACFIVAFVAIAVTGVTAIGTVLFGASAIIALAGAGHAVVGLVEGVSASAGAKSAGAAVGLAVINAGMTLLGAASALLSTMTFTRGRQIRSAGRILLPPVARGSAWTDVAMDPIAVDDAARDALATQWRENGRTEHASVAAFARLTLDLMALGAPPDLVAAANRDALDEIRHAELCFALARAIDGRVESPGAFPEAARARALSRSRTIALAELAVDSLVDGALHEGVSARIVARLARRCEEPRIRAILKEIAADEGRHARHGWDVVRWCLAEGGQPVARALAGAVRALPSRMTSPLPEAARSGAWERWGIMGQALEAEEFGSARAEIVRRVAAACAGVAPRAA
ncbi:MAG: ferritin-like domain-containing protein [Labilithrix sp.]|nr:ferritin-like domain-containing protein [Labilithrix sp.]